MPKADTSLTFPCGITMPNRFLLAPMTNRQSFEDGTLSDEEYHWLTMRSEGGFGMVMTCASHVQEVGKGFEGQLGIFDDKHIPGHQRLAAGIKVHGNIAIVQLHHAGMRSPKELIEGKPVCPSAHEKYGSRALTLEEVIQLKDDFVAAAKRAQDSGYDGVQVHGAHGYILTQFLSKTINLRTDNYGGTLENRSRLLFEIVDEIRETCGPEFLISVRLSPERFGMELGETIQICQRFVDEGKIDFLDVSLWDVFKMPEDEAYQDKSLLEHFTEIDYKGIPLIVAGKIESAADVQKVLDAGVDFVGIGKAGILHHDFPKQVLANENFTATSIPVSPKYLANEGLSPTFIKYMRRWPGFVTES